MPDTGTLENSLRDARAAGRKAVVPYVTGGLGDDWAETIRACAAAGADALEIGVPFSDPVMDGPVIQEASERALEAGATPASILTGLRSLDAGIPLAVMTYYNVAFHMGHERFAQSLRDAGVAAAILPDLPLDEAGPWCAVADDVGFEPFLLAAPTTPDDRLVAICERSRGFVYAVGLLGVTGERTALAESAKVMAKRLKAVTDKPVLVGIGVSNADQAVEVCEVADGVVVGSAVVRRMLEGQGPAGVGAFVASLREGLDA